MRCTRCQNINPDSAKFCMSCGASLTIICPKCQTELPNNAKFCFNCGQALNPIGDVSDAGFFQNKLRQYIPDELLSKLDSVRTNRGMEGERRIVTMLFCDVKGSTAMAETLDPEAWTEIMNRVFGYMIAPVYKYEGTIARLMGDAILAFFGAPIAHEDDPQRAVLAGLAIVEGISAFREEVARTQNLSFDVRVGINTGLVVVGEVGSDLRVEYTAMGDAVNLAARMEQTAQPGTVQISGNTAKLIAPLFELESLGGIEVKGKREPVPSFRVVGRKSVPGQLRGLEGLHSPLIGRDREFNLIRTCMDELIQGRGQLISVMAEAGLGKSRLIAEARKSVASLPIDWFEGRSLSFQASVPYAPLVDLFTAMFDLHADESPEVRYEKIKARVTEVVAEQAYDTAPFLATLLDVQPQGEDNERIRYLEPPPMRSGIFQAVLTFIRRWAMTQPLVMVFEDLHWSDPTSLELLEQLMTLTNHCPLLLIGLFRPHRNEPAWRFHEVAARDYAHRYTAIALEPFDESQARALVANLLQIEDLPEKVRALILSKAEGNPFFVEELIRSLLDAGFVVRDGDHWRATRDIVNIVLPDTLVGVITARLDRLDTNSKRVTQTAAVVGREFQHNVLEAVYDAPLMLDAALANLMQRELIREKSRLPTLHYSFKHVLTQETACGALLKSKYRELHQRVAQCLEQTAPEQTNEIAFHYLEAQESVRALPYLVKAGNNAARSYASVEATDYYRRALEILKLAPDLTLARQTYEGLGRILTLGSDLPGAVDLYQQMLHFAHNHADTFGAQANQPMEVSARNKLAVVSMYMGQFQALDEHLREAERLARECKDAPGLAEMYMTRCMICLGTADFNGAVRHLGDAINVGHEFAADEQVAFGLGHLANTLIFLTRFDDAWKTAQECRQLCEKVGDRLHLSELCGGAIALYHIRNGELNTARLSAEEGQRMAAHIGYAMGETLSNIALTGIAQATGEHERALYYGQRAVQAARTTGYANLIVIALGALGTAYLDISGELIDKVVEFHLEALHLMDHPIGMSGGGMAWAELGFCAMQLGDLDRANDFFQKGLTVPTMQMLLNKPRFLLGAATVALERGQLDEAERLANEAHDYIDVRAMKNFYPFVAFTAAQISAARGQSQRALEQFNHAEALAKSMHMRPLIWHARAASASILTALDRPTEAAAKQSEALAMIDEIAAMFTDEKLRAVYVKSATGKVGI